MAEIIDPKATKNILKRFHLVTGTLLIKKDIMKVEMILPLLKVSIMGMLMCFNEKTPNSTDTRLIMATLKPRLYFVDASEIVDILIP
jgi:hypothetical protein